MEQYIIYNMDSDNEIWFEDVCIQDLLNLLEQIKMSLS
jgi:hypothetical protein